MKPEDVLKTVIEKAEEFKAHRLRILKVSGQCSFADYFVIMSGQSRKHIQSLAEALALEVKHQGLIPLSMEGMADSSWCLLDFGDVIVHVFDEIKRQYFDLESFWDQAEDISKDDVVSQK